jgi:hypothetical protein
MAIQAAGDSYKDRFLKEKIKEDIFSFQKYA